VYAAGTVTGAPVREIDTIVPVATAGTMSLVTNADWTPAGVAHPVLVGVSGFTAPVVEVVSTEDAGAVQLGRFVGSPGVVVGAAGIGRTAYLAPFYASPATSAHSLRSGDADRLLEQAVAWVARDRIPPVVIDTTPALTMGAVPVGTTSLVVRFSEPVEGGDVPANYRLVGEGPDHLLGTTDDIPVPIVLRYAGSTGTLEFDSLSAGSYRLSLVNLRDQAGNLLDGDEDGIPDGLYRRDFLAGAAGATITSPAGFAFDPLGSGPGAGQLVQGPANAFDGLNRLFVDGTSFAPEGDGTSVDGGRTLVTATWTVSGLEIHRELTVPGIGNENFLRTLDVFSNPTGQDVTVTVHVVGNLGSDAATTVFTTSDGDTLIEPTDEWIATDDADGIGTPAIVHFLHGAAGLLPTDLRVVGDNIEWSYQLHIGAGETVRLANFTVVAPSRTEVVASVEALSDEQGFTGQAAAFLSQEESDSLVAFRFGVPPVTTGIANVSLIEDAAPVLIDLNEVFTDSRHIPRPLVFSVSGNSNAGLFDGVVVIDGRWLRLNPRADGNGTADLAVRATDVAGVSTESTFRVSIDAVNDAPVRSAGTLADLTLTEDAGTVSMGFAALAYTPGGGPDESSQQVTVVFTALPPSSLGNLLLEDEASVVTAGTAYTLDDLRGMWFRTTTDANGSALITFQVRDDGTPVGVAEPDWLTETLTVTVSAVNDVPVRVAGDVAYLLVLNTAGLTSTVRARPPGRRPDGQGRSRRLTLSGDLVPPKTSAVFDWPRARWWSRTRSTRSNNSAACISCRAARVPARSPSPLPTTIRCNRGHEPK
ncbi:MAG: hypothetical protein U0840_30025, partial [Gemmataceae bacterium]